MAKLYYRDNILKMPKKKYPPVTLFWKISCILISIAYIMTVALWLLTR